MHPLYLEIKKMVKSSDKIKILYIDDDELMRFQIQKLLSQFFTTNLFIASNGREAFEVFKKELPNIIITDINMPYMNGFKFLDTIKDEVSLVEYYQLAIGIVTSFDDTYYMQKAIEANVDGYIIKPIKFDIFLELFYKLLVKAINMKDATEYSNKLENENIEDGRIKEELRRKIEELEKEERYSNMKNVFIAKDRAKGIIEVIDEPLDDWYKPSNRKDEKIINISEIIFANDSLDYVKDLLVEINSIILLVNDDLKNLMNYSNSIQLFISKFLHISTSNYIIEQVCSEIYSFCDGLKDDKIGDFLIDKNRSVLIGYLELLPRELIKWLEAIEKFGLGSKEEVVRTDMLIITIRQFDEFLKPDISGNIEDIFF
jgi:YesN/AraC family two-component response regulator